MTTVCNGGEALSGRMETLEGTESVDDNQTVEETQSGQDESDGDNFKKPIWPASAMLDADKERSDKSLEVVEMEMLSLSELKKRALCKMSPAELLKEPKPSGVNYREPLWSGLLPDEYWVETIKNGVVIEKFRLDKPMASVGRSKHVDIVLEHPSISRIHAVFQMRPCLGSSGDEQPGLYLYDTGSTHGTFLNKQRIEANCYNRVRVGHVVKFGNSSRLFVVHGPESDLPPASPYTITEIKERNAEMKRRQLEALEERRKQAEKDSESGINWGFKDDAEQESDDEGPNAINPFAMPEELNLEDPKKTLKGCFEREGFELEYICEEQGFGTHICRIELPMVDSADGRPVFAEVANKGKRRDVQVQCALEACRILDAHGILRASTHERHEVKKRNWEENDFYDSDDDIYLDRTGSVEAKRVRRMQRLGATNREDTSSSHKVHTFESLSADLLAVQEELSQLEQRIKASKSHVAKMASLDTLDEYMQGMKSGAEVDATTRRKMKMRTIELKKEICRTEQMREAARPAEIKLNNSSKSSSAAEEEQRVLRMRAATSRFGFAFALNKKQTATDGNSTLDSQSGADSLGNPLLAGAETTSANGNDNLKVKSDADGVEYEVEESESLQTTNSKDTSRSLSQNGSETEPTQKSRAELIDAVTKTSESSKSAERSERNGSQKDDVLREQQSTDYEKQTSKTKRRKAKAREVESLEAVVNAASSFGHDETKDDEEELGDEVLEESEAFSGWMPPTNQKGDGKTQLNDLLGY